MHAHEVIFGPPETNGDAARSASHEEIAVLAYEYWEQRGCPIGSPEADWFRAEEQLRNRERLSAMAEPLIGRNLSG